MSVDLSARALEDLTPAEVPFLRTDVPGEVSRSMFAREARYSSPGGSAVHSLSQLVLQEAFGALLKDVDGNVFIDFGMGMIGVSTGHRHPVVMRAIRNAMDRYLHVYDMTTPERVELYEYLAEVLPANLGRFQMYTGGAEVVEAALRLTKSATKKREFISLYGGFHGKTLGSLSLMGAGSKKGYGPLPGGYFQTPNAYCYRCPLGLQYPSCGVACADMIDKVYEQQTTGDVAAVVVEPMQAAGGMIIPPPEFLPKIEAFCKRKGLVLVVDEIFTGGGRTGKLWGFEHSGVQPNIVTMGKGTGSGFPVGLLAAEDRLVHDWPWNQAAGSSTTYGGNVVAAAAMLATLRVIGEEGMVENSARVGSLMKARFVAMQKKFDFIGDVRGEGLMIGLELVRDRATKEQLSSKLCADLFHAILRRGVLIPSAAAVMRIVPPLMISEELATKGLDLMEQAFEEFQRTADLTPST
jgi:4-aminobutyrate aminotransferase / (S)-3-amino-2-methylpropionate transaminase / 5-aminovalerate transaminase